MVLEDVQLEILHLRSGKHLVTVSNLSPQSRISDVKVELQNSKKHLSAARQSLRCDKGSKSLPDDATLSSLGIRNGSKLYFKDLGPQIGWKTVFLTEYSGPVVLYLFMYSRPRFIYGTLATAPMHTVVHLAAGCWSFHYLKRLLETIFVHRFSHGTMPIANLFKNCSYYWLFSLIIGYFVNHPLYTPPTYGNIQAAIGLGIFIICELGNFSIHMLLRNLRPQGTKTRRIPEPTNNPLTRLVSFVSCPNYTYEVLAWAGFTILTQCLPAGVFTMVGLYQMSVWAIGKHRNYKREFSNYPRSRKAIIPFIL